MNPKAAYTPAIKLPNGEVMLGKSHSILALKAIEVGFKKELVAGNVNYEGIFFSMYPIDENLLPKIDNETSAIEFATSCSKGERDACERSMEQNKKYFKIVVDRWDNLRRLPMIVAAKRLDNGYVYNDGAAHGTIAKLHPDLTFVETAVDTHQLSIAGFLHDDGRFLNREQAAQVSLKLTGIVLNENKLISGEEWIPNLVDEEDAKDFGKRMHLKGLVHAKERVNVFTSLRKHQNHVELLKISIKECERMQAIEIHSRPEKSRR